MKPTGQVLNWAQRSGKKLAISMTSSFLTMKAGHELLMWLQINSKETLKAIESNLLDLLGAKINGNKPGKEPSPTSGGITTGR